MCWRDCSAVYSCKVERAYQKGKLSFHGTCGFLAQPTAVDRLLSSVRAREWWVYAKPPFGGPAQVLTYLGRYTHRVAISNHRLLSLKHGEVTFSWRDNRRGQMRATMTLSAEEFMRRFLLHVLPRASSVFVSSGYSPIAVAMNWCAVANC
jgi:Putative transposase.